MASRERRAALERAAEEEKARRIEELQSVASDEGVILPPRPASRGSSNDDLDEFPSKQRRDSEE